MRRTTRQGQSNPGMARPYYRRCVKNLIADIGRTRRAPSFGATHLRDWVVSTFTATQGGVFPVTGPASIRQQYPDIRPLDMIFRRLDCTLGPGELERTVR